MRAFDDEVALTVAPFYLIHMLQRTFPIFISDKVTLHISREKDGKSGLLYAQIGRFQNRTASRGACAPVPRRYV